MTLLHVLHPDSVLNEGTSSLSVIGGSSCIYRCIVHAQKIMSWYEVGGVMIGSIKRLISFGMSGSGEIGAKCVHMYVLAYTGYPLLRESDRWFQFDSL